MCQRVAELRRWRRRRVQQQLHRPGGLADSDSMLAVPSGCELNYPIINGSALFSPPSSHFVS